MTAADIGNASLREHAGRKWSPAMRRVNRRLAFSVAAAALLAAVTACSADPPRESEPELRPLVVEDMRSFSLPLDEYRVNQANLALYSAANDLLVRRCMARFGFELSVEPRTDIPTAGPPLTEHERRYGLADALSAARYGYHLDPALLEQPSTPTSSHEAGKMAAAFDSVALGSVRRHDGQTVPDGGCLGEAKRKLRNGVPPGAEFLAERLVSDAYEAMLTDSRVVAASAAWSLCMKGLGHHYTRWQAAPRMIRCFRYLKQPNGKSTLQLRTLTARRTSTSF